jgi:hypothetical protein
VAAIVVMATTTPVVAEVRIIHQADVARVIAVDDYNVTGFEIFPCVNEIHGRHLFT